MLESSISKIDVTSVNFINNLILLKVFIMLSCVHPSFALIIKTSLQIEL